MLPTSSIKTVSFTNSFSIVFFARSVKIKDSFLALVLMYVCWGNFDCNTDSLAYLAGYNLQSNCITDKRIPYANYLCAQVTDKFCAFHVISVEFYNTANEMQGRIANITVLFSHCVKKKTTLEEVWLKRLGPRRTIRQREYRISLYQICIFEFAVKLHVADFIDKNIVMQSLMCWKRLVLCDRATVKRRRNATN